MGALTLLALDLTGQALANRIVGEPHSLVTVSASTNRVIMLDRGGFYETNLKVYDSAGRSLKVGVDFVPTYLYDELSELTGQAIYGMIVVKNAAVSAQVTVDYRAVGGVFGLSVKELKALLVAVADENLTVKYSDIIDRPTEFIPEDHTHEWWQVYAMDSTIAELGRIEGGIKVGSSAVEASAKAYGAALVAECQKVIADYTKAAAAHYADTANPHQVTKAQVGLSNLNNWGVAQTYSPTLAIEYKGTKSGAASAVNTFYYEAISSQSVVIAAGDRLVYDLYLTDANARCALDGYFVGGAVNGNAGTIRDWNTGGGVGLKDKAGYAAHPANDLSAVALNKWYHRDIDLSSAAGKTVYRWVMGYENEVPGMYTTRFKQVFILKADGTVKATLFNTTMDVPYPSAQEVSASGWSAISKALVDVNQQNAIYLTPGVAYQILAAAYIPAINGHISDKTNPHRVTAAQLNAYTRAQTDTILATLLDRSATAANTNLLGSYDYATIAANIRQNIPTQNITTGIMAAARLASNAGDYTTALMGNNTFRSMQNLFDTYQANVGNSIYIGRFSTYVPAQQQLDANYTNLTSFPIGTIAFANIYVARVIGDAGGDGLIQQTELQFWLRTGSGWVRSSGQTYKAGNVGSTPVYE